MKKILLYLTMVVLLSCEDFGITPYKFYVDPRLEPYVESFYEEAASRGIYPHQNLRVVIGDTGGKYTLGKSLVQGKHITVTIADWHWENMIRDYANSPDTLTAGMENLVFHEMGHAVLDLDHCDPCNSIMGEDNTIFVYLGNADLRRYMIDELFYRQR